MAYDLFSRQATPVNYARESTPDPLTITAKPSLTALGVGLVTAAVLIIPRLRRARKREWYQREYTRDLTDTQELPAMPMADMMFGPRLSD